MAEISQSGQARYRLIDPEGTDLGRFVSRRGDWQAGERIGGRTGDLLITAVVEPEDDADFQAFLVVVPLVRGDKRRGLSSLTDVRGVAQVESR